MLSPNFFDQFEALRLSVPRPALMNFQQKEGGLGNYTYACEDCFGSVGSDHLKNSHYNYWGYHNTDCVDCTYCYNCISCYECIDCRDCKNSSFLQNSTNCTDCFYCFDCENLRDCFACIGLKDKQYYIFNKPYSREAYFERLNRLKKKSPEELRKLFREIKQKRPLLATHESGNTGICTGDYIYNCTNVRYSFDTRDCAESMYLTNAINCTNCYDISFAGEEPLEDCYEIMSGMGLKNCMFSSCCWYGKNLEYCEYCFECEDCFGCIGLRNKRYHILNVEYSPAEYHARVAAIKEEMKRDGIYGTWFPSAYTFQDTKAFEENTCIRHSFDTSAHRPLSFFAEDSVVIETMPKIH